MKPFRTLLLTAALTGALLTPACPIRFNGLPVSDERCGQFG